jgi:hypothetical protein
MEGTFMCPGIWSVEGIWIAFLVFGPMLLLVLGAILLKGEILLVLFSLYAAELGALMTFHAWSRHVDYAAIRDHGVQATAQITNTERHSSTDALSSAEFRIWHTIALSWHDKAGIERHFGCTLISERSWHHIAADERLVVHQIPIRYLEDEPSARPMAAEDINESEFWETRGIVLNLIIALIGLSVAIAALPRARRAWSSSRSPWGGILQLNRGS